AQAGLVRAAGRRRDAVDVRPNRLVRRLGPLQRELEARVLLPLERELAGVRRRLLALRHDLPQVIRDAALVLELVADGRLLRLVDEDDAEPAVEVRLRLEALADLVGVEEQLAENLRVGPEEDRRPRAA